MCKNYTAKLVNNLAVTKYFCVKITQRVHFFDFFGLILGD